MPLQDFYGTRSRIFLSPAFKLIGFSGSILAAIWTVHKGWHYAEMRLPARLEELNWRRTDFEIRRRADVIPELNHIISISSASVPWPGRLRRMWLQ